MLLHYINKLERNTGQQMMLYRYKNYNNYIISENFILDFEIRRYSIK